jgi:hypothetical protein
MAKYCVVAALKTEWIITNALDEQQCIQQGGVIETRKGTGGCGTETTASHSFQALSESGIAGPTSALSLLPLRLFRTTFERSPIMQQLIHLNSLAAPVMEHIFATNAALGEKVRDAFFTTSLLASSFMGTTDDDISRIFYTKEVHDRLVNLAHEIAHETKDRKFRAALKEVVKTAERFAGKSLLEIKAALNEPASTA